jgi:MtrB/PioB family decaheme-associated outer membrane protein
MRQLRLTRTISYRASLLSIVVAAFSGMTVWAAEAPDTSRWECEYCLEDNTTTRWVSGSLPWVSADDEAYGDYTDLEQGLVPSVSGGLRRRDGEGGFTDILIEDLGRRTARMRMDHGEQGEWGMSLRYQLIPHLTGFDAMTPFFGGRSQELPPSWVPGATSSTMLGLTAALDPVTLGVDRRRIALAFSVPLRDRWSLVADYRHETVRGRRALGANILTTISQLAAPIDRTTDDWHLGGGWGGERFFASIDYRISRYTDGVGSITWDNPFMTALGGATQGRIASTPDNEFQMLSGDFRFDLPGRTRIAFGFGAGSGEQRTPFLPSTINTGLVVSALPRTSLQGDVDVTRWNLRVTSRPIRQLGLRFAHHYDDRDNRTPVDLFPEVTTDSFVGGLVMNVPYDFRRQRTELGVDLRITRGIKAGLEISNRTHRRGSQEVLETDEDQISFSLRAQATPMILITVQVDDVDRDGSNYNAIPGVTDAQNPRLRKFYMADMDRSGGRLRLDLQLRDDIAVGLEHREWDDFYPNTELGLIEASTANTVLDIAWSPNERLNLVAFANEQLIRSAQTGSSSFSTPNWRADDRDDVLVVGAHLDYEFEGPWSLGAGFEFSQYDGHTAVSAGGPSSSFPDLRSDLARMDLGLAHDDGGELSYRFGVLWERLETDDWALDGLSYSTIPSLVALGITSPNYDIVMLYAEVDYGF